MAVSMNLLLLCCIFIVNIGFARLQCTDQGNDKCGITIDQKVQRSHNGESLLLNISVKYPYVTSKWEPVPPNKKIPEGYVHLKGHGYYKYHTTGRNWNSARIICQNEGGHLAVINSKVEAKFIANIPATKYDWAFIGMHDYFSDGQWVTIFDQSLQAAGFDKWHAGEPTRVPSGENCGTIFPDGLLGDHTCHDITTFFCEIN